MFGFISTPASLCSCRSERHHTPEQRPLGKRHFKVTTNGHGKVTNYQATYHFPRLIVSTCEFGSDLDYSDARFVALVDHVEKVEAVGPSCFDDAPFVEVVCVPQRCSRKSFASCVSKGSSRPASQREISPTPRSRKSKTAPSMNASTCRFVAGMEVITDGEVRRYAFYGHLIDAVEGFDKYGGWAIPFRDEKGEQLVLPRPVVVSKLRRKRPLCAEEFTYVRARTKHPAKTTMISAQQAAAYYDSKKSPARMPRLTPTSPTWSTFCATKLSELIRLGCTYIQIDSPQYTALLDPESAGGISAAGQRSRPAAGFVHRNGQCGDR